MNDLLGDWEQAGVDTFIILTAHGHDPHQEALSTLRTRRARIFTVDAFALDFAGQLEDPDGPMHGSELDTSLLLYVAPALVRMERARDFTLSGKRRTGGSIGWEARPPPPLRPPPPRLGAGPDRRDRPRSPPGDPRVSRGRPARAGAHPRPAVPRSFRRAAARPSHGAGTRIPRPPARRDPGRLGVRALPPRRLAGPVPARGRHRDLPPGGTPRGAGGVGPGHGGHDAQPRRRGPAAHHEIGRAHV